jgi:hypothetical protein
MKSPNFIRWQISQDTKSLSGKIILDYIVFAA